MIYSESQEDDLRVDTLSDDYPTYGIENSKLTPEELNQKEYSEDLKESQSVGKEKKSDEELNVKPTPKYNSFEQIKKELVILDLERQIAWEELMSVKHEFKEDLAPSNFVEPAIKTVGVLGGLVLLKNLIFGR